LVGFCVLEEIFVEAFGGYSWVGGLKENEEERDILIRSTLADH
jgi:hypothetical protein